MPNFGVVVDILPGVTPTIVGWAALSKLTGRNYQYMKRLIGLYGFPRPTKFALQEEKSFQAKKTMVWNKQEVETWLSKNDLNNLLSLNLVAAPPAAEWKAVAAIVVKKAVFSK